MMTAQIGMMQKGIADQFSTKLSSRYCLSSQASKEFSAHDRHRHYRYYDFVMVGFVVVLLCSNLIGPGKACVWDLSWIPVIGGMLVFGAGNLFFPISYIFGDVLTEVYGYARARKVIWAGFGAMLFASVMAFFVVNVTPAPNERV